MGKTFAYVDIDFETLGPDHKPGKTLVTEHNNPFQRKRKKQYQLGKTTVIESKSAKHLLIRGE